MLDLDSPRWNDLEHAYGVASDVPGLLRELDVLPTSEAENEPWFSLWSCLAHQGNVYSASFAAVPHVVNVLAQEPSKADDSYFQFPAWVEICRQKNSVPIPKDLEKPYFDALNQMPSLVAAASKKNWNSDFLLCAMSAIATSKGFASTAEAVLELDPETAGEFLEWVSNR